MNIGVRLVKDLHTRSQRAEDVPPSGGRHGSHRFACLALPIHIAHDLGVRIADGLFSCLDNIPGGRPASEAFAGLPPGCRAVSRNGRIGASIGKSPLPIRHT